MKKFVNSASRVQKADFVLADRNTLYVLLSENTYV